MVVISAREQTQPWVLSAIWLASACLLIAHADADVSAGDAGEIGGAAWTLGVAHPTGFPLDMLLLRALGALPLGPLAFRENLCAALVGACVVTCVARLCYLTCQRWGVVDALSCALGATLAAAALLSASTFLAATLSVEVYATALLCVVVAACLSTQPERWRTRTPWSLFGFALGTHVTAAYLIAPLLLARALQPRAEPVRSRWPELRAAALCIGVGALCLAYLPLAAHRDGAFDWGDPETLPRLWRHLAAARIREAYAPALWNVAQAPATKLFEQLAERPLWLVPGAFGLACALVRDRRGALAGLLLFSLDLAYASWINPMGIDELQVGHAALALLALAAGSGSACAVAWARARGPVPFTAAVAAALALLASLGEPVRAAEAHVLAERYGAGSPLIELPARAVYVCESDNACAIALFAIYAEGIRPDMAVVPAQHLWDPTVVRRLAGLRLAPVTEAVLALAPRRRDLAQARVAELIGLRAQRPLFFERWPRHVSAPARLAHAPFLGLGAASEHGAARDDGQAAAGLGALERARFGAAGPTGPLARKLWSNAHEGLAEMWMRAERPHDAVAALRRAVQLAPSRAVARSNLGVALELAGELEQALAETARAVVLEPERPTPWVNLARLTLKLRGPDAARVVLAEADRRVHADERLRALSHALGH